MRYALALVGLLMLSGCVSQRAEQIAQASEDSARAFGRNADTAFDETLAWGIEGRRGEAEARAELAIEQEAQIVHTVRPVDAPWWAPWRAWEPDQQRVISPELAAEIVRIFRQKIEDIDAEANDSRAEWEKAGVDLEDSLTQLARLRRILEVSGLSPEQVDALGAALAEELRRNR